MREFLKRLFSRNPPQQLGLEVGPVSGRSRVAGNDRWFEPPISLVNLIHGICSAGVAVSPRDSIDRSRAQPIIIRARQIIVGAGAFFSSVILLRSPGFPNRQSIGQKIYLQPHAQVFGLFDQPMTRRGTTQDGQGVPAIYNFLGYLKEHHFWWLASILYPASLASFVSFLPPPEHFEIMRQFHQTMSLTVTVKDDPAKSQIVLKDGRAQLNFEESKHDIESFRRCFSLAAKGLLAVGARRVFLPLLRPPLIEKPSDLEKIENLKFTYNDLISYSDHTSGGNQFGADVRRGVTNSSGLVFGTTNVYVADSSLFPTAPGVNPSWTIMAIAHHVATRILTAR